MLLNCLDFPGRYVVRFGPKPSSRVMCTMTLIGTNLFVYGGIKSELLKEMWVCRVSNNYEWLNVTNETAEKDLPNARYGHTAALFKNEIYFFGGRVKEDQKPKEDIVFFNTHSYRFHTETCFCKSRLVYRRNHIAHTIGIHMFINGGIDENGNILHDSWLLNYTSFRWEEVLIKPNTKTYPLAHHASTLVVNSDKKYNLNFNIYQPHEGLGMKSSKKVIILI